MLKPLPIATVERWFVNLGLPWVLTWKPLKSVRKLGCVLLVLLREGSMCPLKKWKLCPQRLYYSRALLGF